ncbi:MAG: hypothetical protein CVV27_14865, partial [Candidatus Melainabacteria bacterium HGW-Melainabacteria-1]
DIPVNHPFTPYGTTPAYFACHLPLYPLLIRLFAVGIGYLGAMLTVTLLCSGLATVLFYQLLRETGAVRFPFWTAVLSLFLPIRWMIYHSVGATEPLFLVLVFASMLSFLRGRYALAFALCGLSSVTRIVGVLFGLAYLCVLIHQRRWKLIPWLAIIPIPLLLTFSFYAWRFGDFWAYFSWNSKLLNPVPLQILMSYAGNNYPQHTELYLLMYLLYGMGTLLLWRWPLFFWYSLVFYVFNFFIFHEDLSRYYIPIAPFALLVAFDSQLSRRSFQILFPLLVCGVYLYSWPLTQANILMEPTWKVLLEHLR